MSMQKRRKNLIAPRLQLRFGLLFLATAGITALVQALFVAYALQQVAGEMPSDGFLLIKEIPAVLRTIVAATLLLLTPFALVLGVLASFRLAGPLHRMRIYLAQLVAGERPEACRLRQSDELQDLCVLLNQATASLREDGAEVAPAESKSAA